MKFLTLASIVATCGLASAASTSVTLYNWCGAGTPTLVLGGRTITQGTLTINGRANATAYLQTGDCLPDGGNCTAADLDLNGSASTVKVSTEPPRRFSVPIGFKIDSKSDNIKISIDFCPRFP